MDAKPTSDGAVSGRDHRRANRTPIRMTMNRKGKNRCFIIAAAIRGATMLVAKIVANARDKNWALTM